MRPRCYVPVHQGLLAPASVLGAARQPTEEPGTFLSVVIVLFLLLLLLLFIVVLAAAGPGETGLSPVAVTMRRLAGPPVDASSAAAARASLSSALSLMLRRCASAARRTPRGVRKNEDGAGESRG